MKKSAHLYSPTPSSSSNGSKLGFSKLEQSSASPSGELNVIEQKIPIDKEVNQELKEENISIVSAKNEDEEVELELYKEENDKLLRKVEELNKEIVQLKAKPACKKCGPENKTSRIISNIIEAVELDIYNKTEGFDRLVVAIKK